MAKILVLSAAPYDFIDEQTKRNVEGVSLQYVPISANPRSGGRVLGVSPVKGSISSDMFREVRAVPGVYDVDLDVVPGAGGRANVRIEAIRFVGPVNLLDILELAQPVAAAK